MLSAMDGRKISAAILGSLAIIVPLLLDMMGLQLNPFIGWPVLFLCALAFVVAVVLFFLPAPKRAITVAKATAHLPDPILNEQLQTIREVEDFICKKDERALRETFDFVRLIEGNVRFSASKTKPEDDRMVDEIFKDGNASVDLRFGRKTDINDRIEIQPLPGKICLINLTARHRAARQRLSAMVASSTLPSGIVAALAEFEKAVQQNVTLIFDSLNQTKSERPDALNQNFILGMPYFGTATGAYWGQFHHLKPEAEKVGGAIREFFKNGGH